MYVYFHGKLQWFRNKNFMIITVKVYIKQKAYKVSPVDILQ